MKHILGVTFLFMVASAEAELFDRGGGFIYDDVLDITWTQDAGMRSSPSDIDTWITKWPGRIR